MISVFLNLCLDRPFLITLQLGFSRFPGTYRVPVLHLGKAFTRGSIGSPIISLTRQVYNHTLLLQKIVLEYASQQFAHCFPFFWFLIPSFWHFSHVTFTGIKLYEVFVSRCLLVPAAGFLSSLIHLVCVFMDIHFQVVLFCSRQL